MSDPELKENMRRLRTELQAALNMDGDTEHERAAHLSAITEAEDLADRIWRELEVRDSEKVTSIAA